MADQYTEVSRRGFGGNILRSIVGVPIGLLLFLASFGVLWFTAGRTNWAQIAERTAVAPASSGGGFDGQRVSVTGAIAGDPVGDPELLAPGPWVSLRREVETFAWVETSQSHSNNHVGGSTTTTTTYTYGTAWTGSVTPTQNFRQPAGHENPTVSLANASFHAPRVTLGRWSLQPGEDTLPEGDRVPVEALARAGRGTVFVAAADALYSRAGAAQSPVVGDTRVRFRALPAGATVTAFGLATGATLGPATVEDSPWLRVIAGDRDAALGTLRAEYSVTGWIGRIVGFFMMWIGLGMFFGPISTFLNVLPALGGASGFVIFVATFAASVVLTTVAVAVTVVLHSLVATVVAVLAAIVAMLLIGRSRKKS